MAKDKHYSSFKELAEAQPDPVEEVAVSQKPHKKSAVGVVAQVEKKMTFDRYAKRKGVKATHLAGMKAYCKNPNTPKTVEQWDEVFKAY